MQKNKIISLDGLDVFENGQSIELAPLTVLTGLNGSGKTAILNTIERQYKNTKRWKWPSMSLITDGIQSEEGDILLFEQPEAGLNPKLQLEAMDLLIEAATHGRTVVVETHSIHLIDRLCRRMMEMEQVRNLASIYFLENIPEKIEVDPVGGIITNNENFFPEFASETEAMVTAGYRNKCNEESKNNIDSFR